MKEGKSLLIIICFEQALSSFLRSRKNKKTSKPAKKKGKSFLFYLSFISRAAFVSIIIMLVLGKRSLACLLSPLINMNMQRCVRKGRESLLLAWIYTLEIFSQPYLVAFL